MKRKLTLLGCLLAGMMIVNSCSDDDDPVIVYHDVTVSDGMFIVNEGSYFDQVNGSLDYLDFATSKVSRNLFKGANGRALGGTPNNALICGSKMYIATQEENRVEVVDVKTLKAYEPVAVTAPRELCTDGEYVYVSSYTGEVSKIDTLQLRVASRSAVVGHNLEGIACRGGYVYVCNAWMDHGNYVYEYFTNVVKLDANSLQKVGDVAVAANPNQLIADGDDLYLASWGNYSDVPAAIQHIDINDQVTTLASATYMALGNGKLYLISSSYDENWQEVNRFTAFDLQTRRETTFTEGKEVVSPCAIGVDPVTGDVFISSRQKYADNYGNEAVSYNRDGFVARYLADGTFVTRYDCGVNPGTLVFVSHTEKVAN